MWYTCRRSTGRWPRTANTQPTHTRIASGGGRRERSSHNPSRSAIAIMPAINPLANRVQPRAPHTQPRAATQAVATQVTRSVGSFATSF